MRGRRLEINGLCGTRPLVLRVIREEVWFISKILITYSDCSGVSGIENIESNHRGGSSPKESADCG